jgi:hypothetical protein
VTTKQPEALRLADLIDNRHCTYGDIDEAADELRRLHQSEREGWRYADEMEQARKRLHEVNIELVEALQVVVRVVPDTWQGVKQAYIAIAKATGEQYEN